MENEQLAQAKKWKKIANVAWYACLGLFVLALITWEWWAPEHPSAVAVNTVCFFLGLIILAEAFLDGRYNALASKSIPVEKYSEKKTFAVRMTIFAVLFIFIFGCVSIIAMLKDEMISAWSIPGMVFLCFALIGNHNLWELFFLKRLGKVEET